jgi:hypothetical protein
MSLQFSENGIEPNIILRFWDIKGTFPNGIRGVIANTQLKLNRPNLNSYKYLIKWEKQTYRYF